MAALQTSSVFQPMYSVLQSFHRLLGQLAAVIISFFHFELGFPDDTLVSITCFSVLSSVADLSSPYPIKNVII